jgi:hypothetical protein
MKTKISVLFFGLLLITNGVFAASLDKPIFINFGLTSTELPWSTYAPWNTFQNCWANNPDNGVENLLDSLGNPTGVKIQVTIFFCRL